MDSRNVDSVLEKPITYFYPQPFKNSVVIGELSEADQIILKHFRKMGEAYQLIATNMVKTLSDMDEREFLALQEAQRKLWLEFGGQPD